MSAVKEEELLDGNVIRLGGDVAARHHPRGELKALPDDFFCTSSDKATDSLSVWDDARTTVEQARAFLNKPTAAAFRLAVNDVRSISVPQTDHYLRIYREPDPDLGNQPGADGHCGIRWLCSASPKARENLRAQLAAFAQPITA